jgi:hypothetical protein
MQVITPSHMRLTNKNLGDRATTGFFNHLLLEFRLQIDAKPLNVCYTTLKEESLCPHAKWANG